MTCLRSSNVNKSWYSRGHNVKGSFGSILEPGFSSLTKGRSTALLTSKQPVTRYQWTQPRSHYCWLSSREATSLLHNTNFKGNLISSVTYLNASQLLHPRKVLGDMCNITKANPINVPLFLENLLPRFLQKNVTALFRALKGCFQKKAKKGSKHC
ncbi:hypothetical protein V5799_029610 [Amblyomma americanum]|uniref:Uncharacterized protein n=1 Tax=Amblyomma americanum TaxID=6943 RepID=A0AAQ4EQJ1_AMBAM